MGVEVTLEFFNKEMGKLIVLKGWPDSVEGYYPALSDIPEDVLPDAITHALRTRTWFPTPAEVRLDCDAVMRHRPVSVSTEPQFYDLPGGGQVVEIKNPFGGKSITLKVGREWKHYCADCVDTGWASRQCGEQSRPCCGRTFEHAPHEFVMRCACYHTNPALIRKREAGQKFSQQPETHA